MRQKIPNSPFVTRLSGSARETELRLRNIFQWKKKRPPVILLLAAVLLVAGCGSLVSFRMAVLKNDARPEIVMQTQYYDTYGNYIEIPMLTLSDGVETNAGINAINLALADLKEQYQTVLDDPDAIYHQCLLYPSVTDRYMNLLFYHARFVTDINTAHISSLVYDLQEGRQVTMEDALTLAGLTEQELFDALSAQYDPQLAQEVPEANIIIQNHALEGFRVDADGQPIFYLTARTDDADDSVQDYANGGEYLYIWADGSFTVYEQGDHLQPLVPAGETLAMNTPLWCQWYFSGEEPSLVVTSKVEVQIEPDRYLLEENSLIPLIKNGQQDLIYASSPNEWPRQAVELSQALRGDFWQNTLIPLACNEEYDVTLYGIVLADSLRNLDDSAPVSLRESDVAGTILRVGDQFVCTLQSWVGNAVFAENPWLEVADFDSDGQLEAAICLTWDHNDMIQVHTEALYLVDLDTFEWHLPTYSTLDINVACDPDNYTTTFSGGNCSATIKTGVCWYSCGKMVEFSCENGQIYCHVELSTGGVKATAPVVWTGNGYRLGQVTELSVVGT